MMCIYFLLCVYILLLIFYWYYIDDNIKYNFVFCIMYGQLNGLQTHIYLFDLILISIFLNLNIKPNNYIQIILFS